MYNIKISSPGCIVGSDSSLLRNLIILTVSELGKPFLHRSYDDGETFLMTCVRRSVGAVGLLVAKALWHRTFSSYSFFYDLGIRLMLLYCRLPIWSRASTEHA